MSRTRPLNLSDRPGDDGFTLVEVLVALSLLSTIGVLMGQFLTQLKAVDRQTAKAERGIIALAEKDYLGGLIAQAVALPYDFDTSGKPVIFSATDNQIVFVAPVRIGSNRFGVRRITIRVSATPAPPVLAFYPVRVEQSGDQSTMEMQQLDDMQTAFRFQFLSEEGDWLTDWNMTSRLPKALRLTISGSAGQVPGNGKVYSFRSYLPLEN